MFDLEEVSGIPASAQQLDALKKSIAASLEGLGDVVSRFGAEASAERIVDDIVLSEFFLIPRPSAAQ
jgi:hypothetical protein